MAHETVDSRRAPPRRSRNRRRCRRTRSAGSPATSSPSGGAAGKFPPGPGDFSFARTHQIARDPLPMLLGAYEELRADLHPAPAPHAGRLHARPGGQPLRHRRPPGELPLARVELRRPDPAARRRPADDRRRLPRPRPGDHDARLPPRAGRRLGRGDDRRGRRRRSTTLRRGEVVDIYEWMRSLAMRIAMRALLGLDPDEAGKGAAAAEHFERALELLRDRLRAAAAARPGLALAQDDRLARRSSTRSSSARSPSRRAEPGLGPDATSSACCSTSATRRARASPTARSATR